jgi:hypothetical protein
VRGEKIAVTESFKRLSLEEARQLAEKWLKKLSNYCELADVVAGVYRAKPENSDVDLICLPKNLGGLRDLNPVKEDSIRIVFNDPDEKGAARKIEVWKAEDKDSYELKKWYRRKERNDFIRLASIAKSRGYTLSWQKGLVDSEGKVITVKPQEIEQILEG